MLRPAFDDLTAVFLHYSYSGASSDTDVANSGRLSWNQAGP